MKVRYLTVASEDVGQRIDNYLIKQCKGVPKARLYRAIRKGEVRVNKKRVRATYRVCAADELRLPPLKQAHQVPLEVSQALVATISQAVVYEDDYILVLNKPTGFAVHKGSGVRLGVIDVLQAYHDAPLYLVHRLDRATSGCLIVAKDRRSLLALQDQLKNHQLQKHYVALLRGHLDIGPDYLVDAKLSQCGAAQGGGPKMIIDEECGQSASTYFTTIKSTNMATLVALKLGTGRTHQIRVHAKYLGHPIAGDQRYGDHRFNVLMQDYGLDRMFLHASRVVFKLHGKEYDVEAELDAALQAILVRIE